MIYGLWYGGHNYSAPSLLDFHLEVFDSIEHAKATLQDRYQSNGRRTCHATFADGRQTDDLYPVVDGATEILLYSHDPRDVINPSPDQVVRFAEPLDHCVLELSTLGSQIVCAQCGAECECYVCLPGADDPIVVVAQPAKRREAKPWTRSI